MEWGTGGKDDLKPKKNDADSKVGFSGGPIMEAGADSIICRVTFRFAGWKGSQSDGWVGVD